MADTSHLPEDVLYALRTGKIPPHLASAHQESETEPDGSDNTGDADAVEARYRQMVDERIADWHEDRPSHWGPIPPAERMLIEDDCNRQLEHEQRAQSQAHAAGEDEWDPGADPLRRQQRR